MVLPIGQSDEPVTREVVQSEAVAWAEDPETVVEIVHIGFNADALSGGFAFLCDSRCSSPTGMPDARSAVGRRRGRDSAVLKMTPTLVPRALTRKGRCGPAP